MHSRTHSDDAFDLLALLLADLAEETELSPDSARFFARLKAADGLWPHLPEEAYYHGVTALVLPALAVLAKASGRQEALPAYRSLLATALRQRAAVDAREQCVSDLLVAFRQASVELALLKGAALARLIYDEPQLRPSLDIDILVDHRSVFRARDIAERLGYAFHADHASRFTPRMNHLPEAHLRRDGFRIALEIHVDALSPTRRETLTVDDLTVPLQPVHRGAGPAGLALAPADMLRHLAFHTFEPSQRLRLIHLYDLWRYGARVGDRPRDAKAHDTSRVEAALAMAVLVFKPEARGAIHDAQGIGRGMSPLSDVLRERRPLQRVAMLFAPSEWWLRGFYGIVPARSLLPTRLVTHPLTLARWLCSRYVARLMRVLSPGAIRLRTSTETRIGRGS